MSLTDLQYFLSLTSLDIIVLHDTWLSKGQGLILPNYNCFRCHRAHGRCGGLTILLSECFHHTAAICYETSTPDFEILGINLRLPSFSTPISLANVSFPHGVLSTDCSGSLLSRCLRDVVIMGDCNSHNTLWDLRTDAAGVRLQSWFGFKNLSVQNTGDCIVFFVACPDNTRITFWSTIDSGSTSDHVPIIFDMSFIISRVYRTMPKFTKTSQCQELLKNSLSRLQCADEESRVNGVLSSISTSLDQVTFRISFLCPTHRSPWWCATCTLAHRRRKAVWKTLMYNQSPHNWSNSTFFNTVFRRTVA